MLSEWKQSIKISGFTQYCIPSEYLVDKMIFNDLSSSDEHNSYGLKLGVKRNSGKCYLNMQIIGLRYDL